ncbi:MAG TPA: exopolysaccharide biosynthesis polyprenyl glycosylphosphotransferase [Solirubrobacteraceae bacterium]
MRESVEALPVPVAGPVRTLRVGRTTAAYLATAGRFGVVWLPAYALLAHRAPSLGHAVALGTVIAAVWFVTLQKSFDAARLTLLTMGPALASAMGTATGAVGVSALGVWLDLHLSGLVLLEMAGAVFVLSWAWEGLVHRSLAGRRRVLVIGEDDGGAGLARELGSCEEAPFDLAALVPDDRLDDIGGLVERHRPEIVVLASVDSRPDAFERLLDVATIGFKVVGVSEFYEHAFGRVPVQTLKPAWFMNVLHLYQRSYTRFAKRTFDLAVAVVALAATAWLFPILWLAVRRTPGPVIFRQTRLGEGGKPFTIYKFRTMRVDAEAAGAAWAACDDPRVTRVGRVMRKTRLDELPQLVNVLKGEMSIVGPRPERPEFLDQLRDAVPFWTRRHLVKPGITGWAQLRRGYTADAEGTADKLSYDLWYLRHRSLAIDLAVCVKTFTTIFTGSGAR